MLRTCEFLLSRTPSESERLELQALTWQPEIETILDEIGTEPGWRCLDVGCGPMGILGPLSRRAGRSGKVVGLDNDPVLLEAARRYAKANALGNVELREGDLFRTDLPPHSFDLVHARFFLAPIG